MVRKTKKDTDMAHKQRKCISSPACSTAVAGGKKHVNKKHALLVATYAKRQGLSFEDAAGVVKKAVDVLLQKGRQLPTSLGEFADAIGIQLPAAGDLMDALLAFGYIKSV